MNKKKYFAASELIINEDGSIFHLHLKPEQLADKVILVGDPGRVALVASHFDTKECEVESREFHTITGTYKGKRITVQSTGIGCDNIDIVLNELDALANIDFKTRTEKDTHRTLTLVRIGTCGGLQPDTPSGTYVASIKSIGGGFFGPQGRELRIPLADPEQNKKVERFEYNGLRITNFEMESSALAGLSALMGHKAMTCCMVIANRLAQKANTGYKNTIDGLIEKVLERI